MRTSQSQLCFLVFISALISMPAHANDELCKALFLQGKPPQVSPELDNHVFETLVRELKNGQPSTPEILRVMITTESSISGKFIQNVEAAAQRHNVILPSELREFSVKTSGYNVTAVGPSQNLALFLIELRQLSPTLHASLGRHVELSLPILELNKKLFGSGDEFSTGTLDELEKHLSDAKPSIIDLPGLSDTLVAMKPLLFERYVSQSLLAKSGLKYFRREAYQKAEVNTALEMVAKAEGVLTITTEGTPRIVLIPTSLLKAFQKARQDLISKPLTREEQVEVFKCANCSIEKEDVFSLLTYKDKTAVTVSVLETDLNANRPAALILQDQQPYLLALRADSVDNLDMSAVESKYFKATGRTLPAQVKDAIALYKRGNHSVNNYEMKIATYVGTEFESIRARQALDGIYQDRKYIAGVVTSQHLERHSGHPIKNLFLIISLREPGEAVHNSAVAKVVVTPEAVETPKAVEPSENVVAEDKPKTDTDRPLPEYSFTAAVMSNHFARMTGSDKSDSLTLHEGNPALILKWHSAPTFFVMDTKAIAGFSLSQLVAVYERFTGQKPSADLIESFSNYAQDPTSAMQLSPQSIIGATYKPTAELLLGKHRLAVITNHKTARSVLMVPIVSAPEETASPELAPADEEDVVESTPMLKVYNGKRTVLRTVLEQDLSREKPAALILHRKTPHSLVLRADAVKDLDLSVLAADYSKVSGRQLPPQIKEAIEAYQANNRTKLAKYAGTDFDSLKAAKSFNRVFDDTDRFAVMTTALVPQYREEPKRDLFLIISLKEAGEVIVQDAPVAAPRKVVPIRLATVPEVSLSKAVTDYYFQSMTDPEDALALNSQNPAMILKWHSKPALLVLDPQTGSDVPQFIEAYERFTGLKPSPKVIESFASYLQNPASVEQLSTSAMSINNYKSTSERLLNTQAVAVLTNSAHAILIIPIVGETPSESAPAKTVGTAETPETTLKLSQMTSQRLFENFSSSDPNVPYALNEARPGIVITRYSKAVLVAFSASVISRMNVEQIEKRYRELTGVPLPTATHEFFSGKRSISRLPQHLLANSTFYPGTLLQIEESGQPILFTAPDAFDREQDAFFLLPYGVNTPEESQPEMAPKPVEEIKDPKSVKPTEPPKAATLNELLESWMKIIIALQSGSPIEEDSSKHILELGSLVKAHPELAKTDEVRLLAHEWAELLSQTGLTSIDKSVLEAATVVMSKAGIALDYGTYMNKPELLVPDVRYQVNSIKPIQISFTGRALRRLLEETKANKKLLRFFDAVAMGIVDQKAPIGIQFPRHRVGNVVEVVFAENNSQSSLYGCYERGHVSIKQFSAKKITAETALAEICD